MRDFVHKLFLIYEIAGQARNDNGIRNGNDIRNDGAFAIRRTHLDCASYVSVSGMRPIRKQKDMSFRVNSIDISFCLLARLIAIAQNR